MSTFCNRVCERVTTTLKTYIPQNRFESFGLGSAVLTALTYSTPMGFFGGLGYVGYKYFSSRKVGAIPPEFVYRPDTSLEQVSLERLASKIEDLKKKKTVLGIAAVIDSKTGKKVPIYIEYCNTECHPGYLTKLKLKMVENNEALGWADLHTFFKSDRFENGAYFTGVLDSQKEYGRDKQWKSKVTLDHLYNEVKRYKSVGFLLLKAIHQIHRNNSDGRMDLGAGYNSHTFYYGLGYRPLDELKDRIIAQAYQNFQKTKEKQNTGRLGEFMMFLPNEARATWLRYIDEDPIGFPQGEKEKKQQ